jgi:hypothetical protein
MSRRRTLSRALTAALAALALVTSPAFARPIQDQPVVPPQPKQDLRMPDTRDAAEGRTLDLRLDGPTGSLAGTTSPSTKPASPDSDNSLPTVGLILAAIAVAAGGAGIATAARKRSRIAA